MADIYISIIIPVYNAQDTIDACLASVAAQTFTHYEVILVDDGSIDASAAIIEQSKQRFGDNHVHYIKQDNAGPSRARNRGIALAKGELIAFLDSDDIWHKEKLERQVAMFLEHPQLGLCATLYGTSNHEKEEPIFISFEELCWRNYFSTPTVIVRKDVLKGIEFPENRKFSEDYYLWLQIANKYPCLLVPWLGAWNVHHKNKFGASGLSARLWDMEKGELSNYRDLFRNGLIPRSKLWFFSSMSFVKYLRRRIISAF